MQCNAASEIVGQSVSMLMPDTHLNKPVKKAEPLETITAFIGST